MNHFRLKILIAIAWLTFTVSLSGWWFIHAWNQIEMNTQSSVRLMLKWEGFSLLLALLAGGAAIVFLIYKERQSYRILNDFYLAFAHDLKNSMTSLQMQVGALRDEYQGRNSPVLERLGKDARRLEMKLENSLELSKVAVTPLFMQTVPLSDVLARVRFHEPDIEISLERDVSVKADRRALELVFTNIINNSIKHGRATRITVSPRIAGPGRIDLRIADNGSGVQERPGPDGLPQAEPGFSQGSGIGLFLVRRLMERMNGKASFPLPEKGEGFVVLLSLNEARAR